MSEIDSVVSLLCGSDVFKDLCGGEVNAVASRMQRKDLAENERLFAEGERTGRMYVVAGGELRVEKSVETGKMIDVNRLHRGDVIGVTSLFTGSAHSTTVTANKATMLYWMDQATFQELVTNEPGVAVGIINYLSHKLRAETRNVAELRSITPPSDPRLQIAFFDTKSYTERSFKQANDERFGLVFLEPRLTLETSRLASGFKVICAFVNDVVDAPVVEALAAEGVEMIALRAAGYNNVDLQACQAHDISVTRVPAYSPHAVAEHTVALMLALNRKIHRAYSRVRDGNFSLSGLLGFDMHGKTVGVVGVGKIGRCVVDILLGFGCKVLGYDKYQDEELAARAGFRYVEMDALLSQSDIITLHAPLLPSTYHLINADTLKMMKRGVMLINTSRGGLIDSPALVEGLKDGRIGSAGLDVYEEESEYFFEDRSDRVIRDDVLARLTSFNNVMITSHQGFFTEEALDNIATTTLANVAEYAEGKRRGELTNAVTPG